MEGLNELLFVWNIRINPDKLRNVHSPTGANIHARLNKLEELLEVYGLQIQSDAAEYRNQESREKPNVITSDHIQYQTALWPLFDLLALRAQSTILAKVLLEKYLECNDSHSK